MVLIKIFLAFSLLTQGSPLTNKYHKPLNKEIKKNLDVQSFDLERKAFSAGEFHAILVDNEIKGYSLISEVAACNLGGCPNFQKVKADLSSEYFDMLLLTDPEMNIVKIKILDYFSDYGYEITSKKYLAKFKDKNVCDFHFQVDGIDAISGATISSSALESMLSLLCKSIEEKG